MVPASNLAFCHAEDDDLQHTPLVIARQSFYGFSGACCVVRVACCVVRGAWCVVRVGIPYATRTTQHCAHEMST